MHGTNMKASEQVTSSSKDTTHTQETNIQVQTRDPGIQTASDLCLRP